MKNLLIQRKIIGICGIIVGIVCISFLFIIGLNELIDPTTNFIFVKYLFPISLINGGIYFIVFGILNYTGILIPYYDEYISEYEKAKNIIVSAVLLIPFWVCFFCTLFYFARSIKWKIIGSMAFIYIIYLIYVNIKILCKNRSK